MNLLANIFKPMLQWLIRAISLSIALVIPQYGVAATPAANDPIVVSFALRPVHHFNQRLDDAQQLGKPWAQSPQQIAKIYAGQSFETIKHNIEGQYHDYYLLSPATKEEPQMLLIVTLDSQHGWHLHRASLSWRCQSQAVFSTQACQ
ncbi:hypothetical protein [Shewanella sp. NIFS-20-20]|uniref:hypothetical protein n=1 Tax=Shewanella sp. NIFS-20-20 TaxID=2853806 RepID=UPI001C486FF0|nr:hypothetical protein [Shewanella sp. NIFS-20-20]MBV7314259.1 hypothetical protein [Shewanella sp. NIFS-20-20]